MNLAHCVSLVIEREFKVMVCHVPDLNSRCHSVGCVPPGHHSL